MNICDKNIPLEIISFEISSDIILLYITLIKLTRAEVLYYKKTNHPQGIAELTMSTIHDNVEDAVDALSALVLYGYQISSTLDWSRRSVDQQLRE